MQQKRTTSDYIQAVEHQMIFIKNSSKLFDEGCSEESVRIAAALSTLLEKRGFSVGLIHRLLVEDVNKLEIYSTIDGEIPDTTRLIFERVTNNTELKNLTRKYDNETKMNCKYLLIFNTTNDEWYIHGYNADQKLISDSCTRLRDNNGGKYLFINFLNAFDFDKDNEDLKKELIIQLDIFLFKIPKKYLSGNPMVGVQGKLHLDVDSTMNSKLKAIPILDTYEAKKKLPLNDWLDENICSVKDKDRKIHYLTRRKLIFTVRDKDGGAHFDPSIQDKAYNHVKSGQEIGIIGDITLATENDHLAILRQIGFEVLQSDILDQINSYLKT